MGHPSSKKRPPSIKDVAELAGVSWSTVSNVIRGRPNVRPETQKRVEDAVRALGYRTNAAGRQLRQGSSNTVVVGVPNLTNPQFASLVEALNAALHEKGLSTVLEATGGDPELERRIVEGRLRLQVDGAILIPSGLTATQIARIDTELPLVVLGQAPDDRPFDVVHPNQNAAARDVVEHLANAGCTDVLFVGHLAHHGSDHRDTGLQAFVEAMRESALAIGAGNVVAVSEWSREAGRDAGRQLAKRKESLQAVFCPDDVLALGVIRGLVESGVSVPSDVRVVGFGGTVEGAHSWPSLTSVEVDGVAIARGAAEIIKQRLAGDDGSPKRLVVDHRFRPGESSPEGQ